MTNIVITGFMGTGKTAVGKETARLLGWQLFDLDQEIEDYERKPIYKIFEEHGESYFRELENKICYEISSHDQIVISTGGGTLINPENQYLLDRNGIIIRLDCSVEKIIKRISPNSDDIHLRPLLSNADPAKRMEALLDERQHVYDKILLSLDTSGFTIPDVANKVVEIYNQSNLEIAYPGGSYDVLIKHHLINHAGYVLKQHDISTNRKLVIISNDVVAGYHIDTLTKSLESAGYTTFQCLIPDGEQHKNINTINDIYMQLAAYQIDRSAIILALGGGVTGDLAGFVAATYMRGLDFINIPTSLLAMVDSSIGGKTGYDLEEGKNLIGAFKQPLFVLVDPNLLLTLDIEEMRCGMAELIKTAIIGDPGLFDEIEQNIENNNWYTKNLGVSWISRSLKVKANILREDPFEKNIRAWLNLGHTLGHALEKLSSYSIRHGEAVSIGTIFAGKLATHLSYLSDSSYRRIYALYEKWGLPVSCPPYPIKEIIQSMINDKKRLNNTIRWILPLEIGKVNIFNDIDQKSIITILQQLGAINENDI